MPYKNKQDKAAYMRGYMRKRRAGLTGILRGSNNIRLESASGTNKTETNVRPVLLDPVKPQSYNSMMVGYVPLNAG